MVCAYEFCRKTEFDAQTPILVVPEDQFDVDLFHAFEDEFDIIERVPFFDDFEHIPVNQGADAEWRFWEGEYRAPYQDPLASVQITDFFSRCFNTYDPKPGVRYTGDEEFDNGMVLLYDNLKSMMVSEFFRVVFNNEELV